MLKHIIKLIWKKKRASRLMMLQFFGSFIICYLLLLLIIFYINNKKSILGFDYKNVWFLNISSPVMEVNDMGDIYLRIDDFLNSYEDVESVTCVEGNVPFMLRFWSRDIKYDGKVSQRANVFFSDDDFADVMKLNITEGRWFNQADDASKTRPVVINKKLKEILFGNENPIDKVFDGENNGECRVVGVIDEYRYRGELSKASPSCFFRTIRGSKKITHNNNDAASNSNLESLSGITLLLRTKQKFTFEKQAKIIQYLETKESGLNFNLKSLDEMRVFNKRFILLPVIIIGIICIFLIINLFVGLFGVLWYNINLRKHEIGLRMSMGAVKDNIYQQFILETLVIASLGIIPGFIIALQFPILKVFDLEIGVYISAILGTIIFIFLLVIISALLPSSQATKIQPAVALHED